MSTATESMARWSAWRAGAGLVLALTCTEGRAEPALEQAPAHWRFDAEASRIDFHLSAVRVIRLDGHFERFQGTVRFDEEGHAQVHLTVDAQSLHMDNRRHRDWARSAEFFHVRRYPQIEFSSDPVPVGLLEHGGALTGTLRVRDVDRPAQFEVTPGACDQPAGPCTIEVAGTIRRSQFGMHSRRVALSDQVRLHMHFVLIPGAEPIQARQ